MADLAEKGKLRGRIGRALGCAVGAVFLADIAKRVRQLEVLRVVRAAFRFWPNVVNVKFLGMRVYMLAAYSTYRAVALQQERPQTTMREAALVVVLLALFLAQPLGIFLSPAAMSLVHFLFIGCTIATPSITHLFRIGDSLRRLAAARTLVHPLSVSLPIVAVIFSLFLSLFRSGLCVSLARCCIDLFTVSRVVASLIFSMPFRVIGSILTSFYQVPFTVGVIALTAILAQPVLVLRSIAGIVGLMPLRIVGFPLFFSFSRLGSLASLAAPLLIAGCWRECRTAMVAISRFVWHRYNITNYGVIYN